MPDPTLRFELEIHGRDKLDRMTNIASLRRAQHDAMEGATVFAKAQLRSRIPVRSGQTRGRITHRVVRTRGGDLEGQIGGKSLAASGFNILQGLEEGTGIHGPRKVRIYPRTAKVLRFVVGDSPVANRGGTVVFARSVAGMRPRRPFARTKEEAGDQIRAVFFARFKVALAKPGP